MKRSSELNTIFDNNQCDKGSLKHQYYRVYELKLQHLKNEHFNMLEIGVFKGSSLASWVDYFPNVSITGLDIFTRVPKDQIAILNHNHVQSFVCDSTKSIPKELQNTKFKVIIDDGLHTYDAQRQTFLNFINLLEDDGVYFIEDFWLWDTLENKNHPWVKQNNKDYSDEQYNNIMEVLSDYKVNIHDLRKGFYVDTCILEIRK